MVLAEEFAKNGHHIEFEQPFEIGSKNPVQGVRVVVVVGSLQSLNSLDSFDAEVPASLEGLSVLAPVPHCYNPNLHLSSSSSNHRSFWKLMGKIDD